MPTLNIYFDLGEHNSVEYKVDGSENVSIVKGDNTVKLDLPEGKHRISVERITKYSSPKCYLKLLNPLLFFKYSFFLVQDSFLFTHDAETASIEFDVELTGDCTVTVDLDVKCLKKDYKDMYYMFSVVSDDACISSVTKNQLPKQYVIRWRLMHIIPSAFWVIALLTALILKKADLGEWIAYCAYCIFAYVHISNVVNSGSSKER